MSREFLLGLLRDRIGMDAASLGDRVLDHAFAEAGRQLGTPTLEALAARVALDRAALTALVEAVVVGETWFFRVAQQFEDLARFARTTARRRRPLRVLSLPCASGEEAWSVAITLREAGLGVDEFEVIGIDVSPLLVARAKLGEYRGGALRVPAPREPWLQAIDGGVTVAPALRSSVQFRIGNALDPNLLLNDAPFDVVFCRNLLIYLTPDAREQVFNTLRKSLAQPALVLSGQAEVLTVLTRGFVPMPQASPLSYLYDATTTDAVKTRIHSSLERAYARPSALPEHASRLSDALMTTASVARMPTMPPLQSTLGAMPEIQVAMAQRLADSGDLGGARDACRNHLDSAPQDVDAHLLLGIIESARGDVEAADAAFATVLFLDHHHLDALERRALLADRRGRAEDARRLRARAGRSRAQRTPTL